jgi:penicillin-binding protein 2
MRSRSTGRQFVIVAIFIAVIVIYIARLFYVQVIEDKYKMSADNNVLRYVIDYPARGDIYDRNGKLMVYNEAVYDLMVIPKQVKEFDTLEFCRLISITPDDLRSKYKKARSYSPVKSSILEKQLSSETYAALQEKLYKFKGFYVQPRTIRKYKESIAAHLMGYIGEVNDAIIEKKPYYRMGDYIGISGIEQSYENELRGQRGLEIVMVDVFNRTKGSFQDGRYDTAAVAGFDLTTTLDAGLQAYGEQLMSNKLGGIVAIEPATGEILAMVSSPTYDPNLMVGRIRSRNYGMLLKDPLKPLFNRSQMAYYPPGSTFKLVNALIAMQEEVITPETRFPCNYFIGSRPMKCHPHPGPADLKMAVQYSCNPYYCHVFKNTIDHRKFSNSEEGYNTWRDHVLSFGVGRRLEVDMPHELPGLVPAVEYYDRFFGKKRWKASTIISLGIGQGELGVTPLQMANIMCVIANRGFYYIPHIGKSIGKGQPIDAKYRERQISDINPAHFSSIIDGMQAVVDAGTARGSKLANIIMCGKTGTSQNPHGKDHSLFVGFAPRDNPKIAIAVMVENAGFGSQWAAPIASLMIEKYLTDTITRPAMEERLLNGNLLPQPKVTNLPAN